MTKDSKTIKVGDFIKINAKHLKVYEVLEIQGGEIIKVSHQNHPQIKLSAFQYGDEIQITGIGRHKFEII